MHVVRALLRIARPFCRFHHFAMARHVRSASHLSRRQSPRRVFAACERVSHFFRRFPFSRSTAAQLRHVRFRTRAFIPRALSSRPIDWRTTSPRSILREYLSARVLFLSGRLASNFVPFDSTRAPVRTRIDATMSTRRVATKRELHSRSRHAVSWRSSAYD